MAFPEKFLDELIYRNEISEVVSDYVSLKPSGSNLFGLCPFHSEKTPSFSVSRDKQIYHCFGCGKGGGVINFIMEIENLSFPDAVHFLAKRANIPVPEDEENDIFVQRRRRLLALNKDAARFFHAKLLEPAGRNVAEYVASRGILPASVTSFGLGAAPDSWTDLVYAMQNKGYTPSELIDAGLAVKSSKGNIFDFFRNRFIFPLIDVRGDVVGFSGRRITTDEKERKFIHSKETMLFDKSRFLFGLNLAKKTKLEQLILVEGNVDVITLRQAGFDNAIASLGTSLTEQQARMISNYTKEIVIAYDSDTAGVAATSRAIERLEKLGISIKVLHVPGNKDPDEFIRANGRDAFQLLLSGTENHMDYRLLTLRNKYDINIDEQKVSYLKEASELLAKLPGYVEREVYGARVAQTAGISMEAMKLEINNAFKRLQRSEKSKQRRVDLDISRSAQPVSRSIRYDNIRSARAEEGVIQLLFLDPTLADSLDGRLSEDDFSSSYLAKIFSLLKARISSGSSLSLALFAPDLDADEMSQLTNIMQKPQAASNSSAALNDYISVIKDEKLKTSSDLLSISEKYKMQKGYK